MDNIIRITFPSFSRLQHETNHLAKAIEKSLFALALVIFPSLIGLVLLGPQFIRIIPRYEKWEPALISLAFFAVNAGLSSISTPLTNALNAIGKIKVTLYLMIFWVIATWILTPLAIHFYGYNGFAGASAIVAVSVIIVIWLTKKYIPFSVKVLRAPILSSVVMLLLLAGLIRVLPVSLPSIGLEIVVSTIIYIGCMYILAKEEVKKDILLIKQQFVK